MVPEEQQVSGLLSTLQGTLRDQTDKWTACGSRSTEVAKGLPPHSSCVRRLQEKRALVMSEETARYVRIVKILDDLPPWVDED